jgi:hypothetical protein
MISFSVENREAFSSMLSGADGALSAPGGEPAEKNGREIAEPACERVIRLT